MRGKGLAAMVAMLVLVFACAPPTHTPVDISPSPSPTPTSELLATSAGFHGGEIGVSYAPVALMVTGGLAPYKWTVSAGTLPPGLALGNDGTVSGTPTAGGKFVFTAQLADSGNSTATIDGAIFIADRIAANLISACSKYCNVELGCVDVCGNFGSLSGGVSPFQYTLAQGPLPAGTSLDGLSLRGTFRGLSGYLRFKVQVTDSMGASTTISPTFWMYDHISVASGTCTGRGKCAVSLAYTGGTPGPLPTATSTGWAGANCGATAPVTCPQPTLTAGYQSGVVNITLVYQANYPATFGDMTVQITDNSLCGQGTYCSATATVKVVG